jgi:hypothetical protein
MKITKEYLKQIIKEEIQKQQLQEGMLGNLFKSALLAGSLATAGIGAGKLVTKDTYSQKANTDTDRLFDSAKKAIFQKINPDGSYDDPRTKATFKMHLPKLVDDGRLTFSEDERFLNVFLDKKPVVKLDKVKKISIEVK